MKVSLVSALVLTVFAFGSHAANASSKRGDYTLMDSSQEAVDWVTRWERVRAGSSGVTPREIVQLSDARYQKLTQQMQQVWSGFKKVFPAQTAGLPVPPVVLLEDKAVNAYAIYSKTTKELPFLFIVHTSALNASDSERLGLISHELAHLLLKHGLPGNREKVQIFYSVPPGAKEPLGLAQKNDATLQSAVGRYLKLADQVGSLANEELNGLIVDFTQNADYTSVQTSILAKYAKQQPEKVSCKLAAQTYQDLATTAFASFSVLTYQLNLTPETSKTLSALSEKVLLSMRECVGTDKPDLIALYAGSTGLNPDVVRGLIPAADVKAFDAATNFVDATLSLSAPRQAEMRQIEKRIDLGRVRVYSYEEQADEAAARVLKAIGHDSKLLSEFLLTTLSENDKAACLQQITDGKVPAYGPLSDPHHAICFRVYHLKEYEAYLPAEATPISRNNMAAYCRGAVAGQYGTNPKYVKTARTVTAKDGSLSISGTVDKGSEGIKKFRCRFDKARVFVDVMAMTKDGE